MELAGTDDIHNYKLLFNQLAIEPSAFVRRSIINLLGNKVSDKILTLTAKELASKEAVVRNSALEILVLQGIRAIDVLRDLMSAQSSDLRKMAADALGRIANPLVIEPLVFGLNDADVNVVVACAEALGSIGSKSAIPALEKTLHRADNFWVAFAVLGALAKMEDNCVLLIADRYIDERVWNSRETSMLLQHWIAIVARYGNKSNFDKALGMYAAHGLTATNIIELSYGYLERGIEIESGRPLLLRLLPEAVKNACDLKAAHIACRYLPELVWDNADFLAGKFGQSPENREELAGILGQLPIDTDKICELLRHSTGNFTKILILMAEQKGITIPVDLIQELATGQDVAVLQSLIKLAGRCGTSANNFLYSICQHANEEIRMLAGDKLNLIEEAMPEDGLFKALVHKSEAVRRQAVKNLLVLNSDMFLEKLGEVFLQASGMAKPDVLAVAIHWNLPAVREMAEEAIVAGDTAARIRIASVCQDIKSEAMFLQVIETLLNDPEEEVRRAAIISLRHRKGEGVYAHLYSLYRYDSCRDNRYFILNCDEIYEQIHFAETWSWLEDSLKSGDRLLQLAAVKGMSRMGEQGRDYLLDFMNNNPDDEVILEIIRQLLYKDGGPDNEFIT